MLIDGYYSTVVASYVGTFTALSSINFKLRKYPVVVKNGVFSTRAFLPRNGRKQTVVHLRL